MPECFEFHQDEKTKLVIPHEYIAGICIHQAMVGSSLLAFLEYTYPYYQSFDYERSKRLQRGASSPD